MRNRIVLSILGITALVCAGSIFAPHSLAQSQPNPSSQSQTQSPNQFDLPTCKAGLHLISPSDDDFKHAAELVNSNGGDYCWMTIVLREDEMKVENLQRLHNLAREYHFQLIHRLEKGFDSKGNWYMPDLGTVQKFISAMEKITPSQKDIYVVLGNEPTHSAMCGGCTPESYAQWAFQAIGALHRARFNAIVMLAGQDLHSPESPPDYYDAGNFIRRMFAAEPELPCVVDAWASHNYGSGAAQGRFSGRGYEWELGFAEREAQDSCKSHVKELPVFITETGYRVGAGGVSDEVAYSGMRNLLASYDSDPRVVAATIFTYHFCGEPFESFAVARCEGTGLNGVGRALLESPKVKGQVRHIHKAETKVECPIELVSNIDAECTISAKNLGTDVWKNIEGDYNLGIIGYANSGLKGPTYSFSQFRSIHPGDTLSSQLTYNPGSQLGMHELNIGLFQGGRLLLSLATVRLESFAPPSAQLKVQTILGGAVDSSDEESQVQIFDANDRILFRKKLPIVDGAADVGPIENVDFSHCYRIVLLVDGSLPVQKQCVTFAKGQNELEMPRLLDVDSNKDGKLSLSDVLSKFSNQ